MTSYIDNLLSLIESTQEEQDRLADAAAEERMAREQRMTAILNAAVDKIGLNVANHNYSIGYDEESNREAHIDIYDGATIEQLYALADLAGSVKVEGHPSHIDVVRITMRMKPGIEDAVISEGKHRVVSSKTLDHLRDWGAEHVIDATDEVKSRGQSAIDGAALKQASDDIDFARRALPTSDRGKPIRQIRGRAPKVTESTGESTITLTEPEAEVAAEALNHAWREVFDRSMNGKGGILYRVLKRIGALTSKRY